MNRRPNILILMTDQHRYDSLGCAGHPVVSTPNLDRLAARGMRFSSATTVSPVCMPARASFINSLYPHNHGMWFNSGEVPPCEPTLFKLLQAAGYRTAHLGKSHYYPHKGVTDHMVHREPYMHALGFDDVHETTGPYATLKTRSYLTDRWERLGLYETFKADYHERMARGGLMVRPSPLPEEEFPDTYVGRKAVEYIESYDDDKPACLFVGFGGPHDPWDAPEPWAAMVDPADTPAAIPPGEATPELPGELRDKPDLQSRDDLTPETVAAIRANYYGKISLIDRWIGRIMEAADNAGWGDNLLVVFWSDHGEMAGDHGRIQKCTFYESSVRVPMMLSWPGVVPEGTVSDALVEIIDVFPTLLEVVGAQRPRRCLGRPLQGLFDDPTNELRASQLSEISLGGSRSTMLRTRQHKIVLDDRGRTYMLHDLQADPDEQHNLAADPSSSTLAEHLRGQLFERLLEAQVVL